MSSLSIDQVANYRPLSRCGIEELAAHTITATPSGGILFARKREHDEKDKARLAILDLLSPENHPGHLRILTMPGVDWKFERKLFGLREGDWFKKQMPQRTSVTCIENDRSIYHAALLRMPGLQHRGARTEVLPPKVYAERSVRTRWISHFSFGNVDDLMRIYANPAERPYDCVWLDYTGPLTVDRLRLIRTFYQFAVRGTLIVTALRARWNRDTSDAITRMGGHSRWFTTAVDGDVLHDIDYQDGGSPMAQIAIRKAATS